MLPAILRAMNFYDATVLLFAAVKEKNIKVISVHSVYKIGVSISMVLLNTPFGIP